MKFFLLILTIILGGWIAHQFLPWYAIVLVALIAAALFRERAGLSFAAGFLGGLLLWGAYAWYLNSGNDGILATRMGLLFGGISASMLVIVTALFAGLLTGLGALTGSMGRNVYSSF